MGFEARSSAAAPGGLLQALAVAESECLMVVEQEAGSWWAASAAGREPRGVAAAAAGARYALGSCAASVVRAIGAAPACQPSSDSQAFHAPDAGRARRNAFDGRKHDAHHGAARHLKRALPQQPRTRRQPPRRPNKDPGCGPSCVRMWAALSICPEQPPEPHSARVPARVPLPSPCAATARVRQSSAVQWPRARGGAPQPALAGGQQRRQRPGAGLLSCRLLPAGRRQDHRLHALRADDAAARRDDWDRLQEAGTAPQVGQQGVCAVRPVVPQLESGKAQPRAVAELQADAGCWSQSLPGLAPSSKAIRGTQGGTPHCHDAANIPSHASIDSLEHGACPSIARATATAA